MRQLQRIVGGIIGNSGKVYRRPGCELGELRCIQGECRAYFWVPANGLAIIEQYDRLTVGGNLDCTVTNAFRQYSLYLAFDGGAFQAIAHAITAVRNSVLVAKKTPLLEAAEVVFLVSGNDAHGNTVLIPGLVGLRQIQRLSVGMGCAGKNISRRNFVTIQPAKLFSHDC